MSSTHSRLFASLFILLALAACGKKEASISPLTPSSLTFEGRSGLVVTEAKVISFQNTGNADLIYSATENVPWLRISEGGMGTVAPQQAATLKVQATCVGVEQETQTTTVSVSSNAPLNVQTVSVQLTCSGSGPGPAPDPTKYNIEILGLGSGFTPERQAVFEQAAALWANVITGDLADVPIEIPVNQACNPLFATPAFSGTIDDLLIYASIAPIDGPGGVLGQAAPAAIRGDTDDLTFVGCMQFDVDDVAGLEAEGTFDETILHEMGHVLGIGSLWEPGGPNTRDLLEYTTNPPGQPCRTNGNVVFSQPPKFTGSGAVTEFEALGGSGNVPVEDEFSVGTRCSHWDEAYFSTELMTGFLGPGNVNPISRMTIASLQDLGYVVDLNQAEPYSIPACSPNCAGLQSQLEPIWEVVLSPKFTVTPEGKLAPLPNK